MTDLSHQYTSSSKQDVLGNMNPPRYHHDNDDVDLGGDVDDVLFQHRILPCYCLRVITDIERQIKYRWWILGTTTISLIFSYVSVADCNFLKLDYGEDNNLFNAPQLGLFTMAVFDESGKPYGCVPQNGDERFKDGAFGLGRTFGVLTLMLEIILFVSIAWILLIMRPDWSLQAWKILQCLCLVALFCQLMMFSLFGSPVCDVIEQETFGSNQPIPSECSPGAASILAILNIFLLIGLIVLICMVPAPVHPHFIRWSDDDDGAGTDDQMMDDFMKDDVDDDRSDGGFGNGTNYWSSDDDMPFSDDSDDLYDPNIKSYDSSDQEQAPKKKKKKKKRKKSFDTDDDDDEPAVSSGVPS